MNITQIHHFNQLQGEASCKQKMSSTFVNISTKLVSLFCHTLQTEKEKGEKKKAKIIKKKINRGVSIQISRCVKYEISSDHKRLFIILLS